MATRRDFAELLRQERRALGLTQAELAERAQLSERAISDMERGLKTPHRATVRLLGEALRLAPERLEDLEAARQARRQFALSSAAPTGHSLPVARTTFIGRERLLAEVRRLMAATSTGARLLTLTGPGGTGKTRVALAAAQGLLEAFPDGVYFVDLGAISDSGLVASTMAQTLGVPVGGRQRPLDVLRNYLRDRHLLLVLDNFEQVLGAAVEVGELLSTCPRLHVLVTSRAPLRLVGEMELTVPPLGLPEAGSDHCQALEQYESVQLYVERVRAIWSDFALTDENAAAVGEICRRLDGLPLAIELAAARSRLLEPRAMLAPLETRLQWLTGGARDAPARQQTLRNTIAWSYELLDPEEQALFRHLAVFVGGCSLEAVQAVHGEDQTLDRIDSLVAKNLLRSMRTTDAEVRVGPLETIREFGLEQLAERGELEPLRRRHADYFLALAERAEPGLGGPTTRGWLDRLELEHDNLRAALEWSLTPPIHTSDLALRLAGALARFWWLGGHFGEGSRWLNRALATSQAGTSARMKALSGAGWLAHMQHDLAAARGLLEESLAIAEKVHDERARAWVLHVLGRTAYFEHDVARARQFGERSLRIASTLGDRWLTGWAVHLLGLAAHIAHDDAAAHAYYEQSLTIRNELGHLEGIVIVLHLRGMLHHRAGDYPAALALYRESLEIAGDLRAAWLERTILSLFAGLAAERQPELAARLGGAVTVMSQSAHTLNIPLTEALFTSGMQAARRRLGDSAFATAWAEGRAMSPAAVSAAAWSVEVAPRAEFPARLTAAEVQVLRRVAGGWTTAQIAAELVVAVSTVDRHLTHIYQKIGRRGRVAAAAFALEHGLT
jgi:non-specific serine/threonine protein kinase